MQNKALAINFDLGKLINKKGELVLTNSIENEIVKLIHTKKVIDELLSAIEAAVAEGMEKGNTTLIEKEKLKITRSTTGRRYAFDPKNPVLAEFKKEIKYDGIDTAKVDGYLESFGELPKGIIENARKQSIKIELIDEI